jgi:hypothetical protein
MPFKVQKLMALMVAALAWAMPAFAQEGSNIGPFSYLDIRRTGIQFMGISASAGYTSLPVGLLPTVFAPSFNRGAVQYGMSTGFGWRRSGEFGGTAIQYSAAYNGATNLDFAKSWSSGQTLSISQTNKIGAKWNFAFSAVASESHIEQSLFQVSSSAALASLPVTFDDLASALLSGRTTEPLLSGALNRGTLASSPTRALLYGTHMLAAGVRATALYTPTARLSFSFSGTGDRAMPLPDSRMTTFRDYALTKTTSAGMTAGVSWAVSSRTSIGFSGGFSRVMSNYQDAWMNNAGLSFSRTLSRRWFLQASAGTGTFVTVRQVLPLPRGLQWNAGGGIGFKTFSHTIVGSAARMFGDSFGIGGASTISTSAAWAFRRPGRSWQLAASISHEQMRRSIFTDVQSLQSNFTASQALSRSFSLSATYAWLRTNGTINPQSIYPDIYSLGSHSVRLSVSWVPHQGAGRR